MKILFVEYPKCTTCQKAKKWLEEQGIDFEDRHIVEENPTEEELRVWWKKSGFPLKRFFNTSGMKYRELQLKIVCLLWMRKSRYGFLPLTACW